jgi:hypothetical protein
MELMVVQLPLVLHHNEYMERVVLQMVDVSILHRHLIFAVQAMVLQHLRHLALDNIHFHGHGLVVD